MEINITEVKNWLSEDLEEITKVMYQVKEESEKKCLKTKIIDLLDKSLLAYTFDGTNEYFKGTITINNCLPFVSRVKTTITFVMNYPVKNWEDRYCKIWKNVVYEDATTSLDYEKIVLDEISSNVSPQKFYDTIFDLLKGEE